MPLFLVGIPFHEPEAYALYQKGAVEDFESSTGLFVMAETPAAATAWAAEVGEALLRQVNSDATLDWKGEYSCWIETDPSQSAWRHSLDFFQSVAVGEWPNLDEMGTPAYVRWAAANGIR